MNRRPALIALALVASCTRVKRPGGGDDPADAAGVIDGAPRDALSADACPTDPCLANRFPSTGEDGAFAPDSDTVLPPGVHHFTTITIPAGVTVTTTANGRLDMRARGGVVIEGVIDVSGGRGGDGGVVPGVCGTDQTCFGGGGGGGATADPTPIDPGVANCGLPGPGGAASAGLDGGEYVATVQCPDQGGSSGGGAGGSVCMGGGGGGGFAGGGGGGGYINGGMVGNGGNGASFGGSNGGAGGIQQSTAGGGGLAPGQYRGRDGTTFNSGCASLPGSNGGGGSIGAVQADDLAVATTFYVGSGGGGGGGQCNTCNCTGGTGSGGGGGGGGALRIASGTSIRIAGSILANGGDGGNAASAGAAGGGAGSGGVLYLSAPVLTVDAAAVVSAVGGTGGLAGDGGADCGRGGNGGLGRIRLSVRTGGCTLEGTFDPPLADGCTASDAPATVYIAEYPD